MRALFLCPISSPRDLMPKRTDISTILIIGAGPIVIGQACEFDYSGTQAVQGAEGRGLSDRPGQFQSGDDHDRSGTGRRHLYRADHAGDRRQDHREGTHVIPGGFALLPTMGGQTALNCALSLRRQGTLDKFDVEMIGATADAIDKAEDRQLFREAMKDRPGDAEIATRQCLGLKKSTATSISPKREEAPARAGSARTPVDARRERPKRCRSSARRSADGAIRHRPARDHPALLHHGRHRRRHRLQQGGVHRDRRARHRRLADQRGADRGTRARLERVRDGGGARQEGQLHHHLLDREPRSDGRAHRRFHHGRAGADADRQGIPDHARRLAGGAARDRGRDRRLQRAVRRQSGRRPHGRDRDEPAGVALLRAGLEGDRLSDRQSRRQARGRLHARRDRQRHHRRRDAGLVRADHRLRRHQDPALCVREISRRLAPR